MFPKHVLVGCTGSVATIKLPELVQKIKAKREDCEIRIVLTESALHFVKLEELRKEENVIVYTDADEWAMWQGRGDPVLHIDLTKWADIFVIAPLDANSLGKIASGICDNLLLCIVRAWDTENFEKRLAFAPAMNTKMWNHPVTKEQVSKLEEWAYWQIPPISKTLMCGDVGVGAMAELETIVGVIEAFFNPIVL